MCSEQEAGGGFAIWGKLISIPLIRVWRILCVVSSINLLLLSIKKMYQYWKYLALEKKYWYQCRFKFWAKSHFVPNLKVGTEQESVYEKVKQKNKQF